MDGINMRRMTGDGYSSYGAPYLPGTTTTEYLPRTTFPVTTTHTGGTSWHYSNGAYDRYPRQASTMPARSEPPIVVRSAGTTLARTSFPSTSYTSTSFPSTSPTIRQYTKEEADRVFAESARSKSSSIIAAEPQKTVEKVAELPKTIAAEAAEVPKAMPVVAAAPEPEPIKPKSDGDTKPKSKEEVAQAIFPGAVGYDELIKTVTACLAQNGYAVEETLLATSTCAHTVNSSLDNDVSENWGRRFCMGGLAGFPFVGATGMGAFMHHVPRHGCMLIICASHLGIDETGQPGQVEQKDTYTGEIRMSKTCLAPVMAYQFCKANKDKIDRILARDPTVYPGFADPLDEQQNRIMVFVAENYWEITRAGYPMVALAKLLAKQILKEVKAIVPKDLMFPVAIMNGVQINFGDCGDCEEDYFWAQSFDLTHPDGRVTDLLGKTLADFNDNIEQESAEVNFPNSEANTSLMARVEKCLEARGYPPSKTTFGTSCCPDEINRDLDEDVRPIWGHPFCMGGLAGFPFMGRTGIAQFMDETRRDGLMFIICASHVGIDPQGVVGQVHRVGMEHCSTACGAAVGAFKFCDSNADKLDRILNGDASAYPGFGNENDPQQNYITKFMASAHGQIAAHEDPMVALAVTCAERIREDLERIIPDNLPFALAVLSGIQINFEGPHTGEDFFCPLSFKLTEPHSGRVHDLMPEILKKDD